MSAQPEMTYINKQKKRRGWSRLWHAAGYSMQGLRDVWGEPAFRLESLVTVVLLPCAFLLGRNWAEVALLLGALVLVLVIEIINTAIEAVVDRVGPEWHLLSKRAKDLGSAATLLAMLLAAGIWLAAIYHAFRPS